MRELLNRLVRRRALQPFWQALHGISLVSMNFWANRLRSTGEHEAVRYAARKLPRAPRPIIFDVGANVGEFSELCCATFHEPDVYAFEPSLATFDILNNNLARANANVSTHRLGFSDEPRDAQLYSSEPGSTIASVHQLERPIRPFHDRFTEIIKLATIDDFCRERGIDRIDYLKLDIEGHEYHALVGAHGLLSAGAIRFIQFEFGENNVSSRTYLNDFIKLLGDRYDFYRIVPGGLVPWRYRGGRSEIFATMNYLCERRD
ncbi:MAG TPA: FkbM family methyltransferase [Sphingomicrobium sp.]|nr:FkbM family methyltransferase [Sphingomicrobium sp.]